MSLPSPITVLQNLKLSGAQFTDSQIVAGADGSTITLSLPSSAGTLALASEVQALESSAASTYATISTAQTLTNKTLTEPKIAVIKNGESGSEVSITVPSSAGTLALTSDISSAQSTLNSSISANASDISALNTKLGRLLDYLEAWISCGNLSLVGVKNYVNQPQSQS